jgi:hypothetical protein
MRLRKRAAFLGSAQDCIGAEQLGLASDLSHRTSDPLAFEKEKLALEKEKLALEKEKLALEKEKLALDKAKLAFKADEFAQELAQRKEQDEWELEKKDKEQRIDWFYLNLSLT